MGLSRISAHFPIVTPAANRFMGSCPYPAPVCPRAPPDDGFKGLSVIIQPHPTDRPPEYRRMRFCLYRRRGPAIRRPPTGA